ncbi:MAG: hypothetical protein M1818_002666 [Claussenomyces sp. TS43310]|nr:MAG: hypothetical protein M1818_002666 [Claussenomyces sp. TS43310]
MKAYIAVPAIAALVYRAWSHKSLTPAGCVVAALTAAAHAVHPWSMPFALLAVFYLAGTRVTKIKKDVKSKLTMDAAGHGGGEGPRTYVQVLANSGVASVLTLLHAYQLSQRPGGASSCYAWRGDLLVVGIIANYAAVSADTFSSELGILSTRKPRLLTSYNLREVPPGTNGGVTLLGLGAGFLGSLVVTTAAMVLLPYCGHGWEQQQRRGFAWGMMLWGGLGSLLDSLLGALLQQSVVDTRSGRIVEGPGGKRVLLSAVGPNSMHFQKRAEVKAALLHGDGKDAVAHPLPAAEGQEHEARIEARLDERMGLGHATSKTTSGDGEPSRKVESGWALLDNNDVNFLMALTMSVGAMAVASHAWDVPLQSIFQV